MWNVNRGDTLPAAHRSVKSQVCQLVHVIRKSLVHIAAIFGQRQSVDGRQSEWVGQRRSNAVEAVDRVTVCHEITWFPPPHPHTAPSLLLQTLIEFTSREKQGRGS